MSDEAKPRIDEAEQIVAALGRDRGARSLAHEIRSFLLASIADPETAIDSGGGDGDADLWVTVDGVEYYIHIRHSNAQIAKSVHPPP